MEYFLLKQHLTVEKDLNTYFLCVKRMNNKKDLSQNSARAAVNQTFTAVSNNLLTIYGNLENCIWYILYFSIKITSPAKKIHKEILQKIWPTKLCLGMHLANFQ